MRWPSAAVLGVVVSAGAFALNAVPAEACSRWHGCERPRVEQPRYRYYKVPDAGVRYYRANPCGYGDCACIRAYAVRTKAQVWWDRYQACSGN